MNETDVLINCPLVSRSYILIYMHGIEKLFTVRV